MLTFKILGLFFLERFEIPRLFCFCLTIVTFLRQFFLSKNVPYKCDLHLRSICIKLQILSMIQANKRKILMTKEKTWIAEVLLKKTLLLAEFSAKSCNMREEVKVKRMGQFYDSQCSTILAWHIALQSLLIWPVLSNVVWHSWK